MRIFSGEEDRAYNSHWDLMVIIAATNLHDNRPATKYKWIEISEIIPTYLTL